ncbi:hypothetical protein LZ198_13520 [Myxococcus sp. K15C18031901]|uniref:hypothetical protein n=1 Tax=Myxococcus dinghuensis TaxID=2906761 RepID=UPI0020A745E4|nr:hypothetical protein [Myxococcus dinghuensis]MCP3099889.1 hypothetical protein [Myxococcus dinghuensis]
MSRTPARKVSRVSAHRRRSGVSSRRVSSSRYTHPMMRERIRKRLMQGSRGGPAGVWSARKAQMLATEYERAGGGYRGRKTPAQKSLSAWARVRRTPTRRVGKKATSSRVSARRKSMPARRKRMVSRRGRAHRAVVPMMRRTRRMVARR